jgi:hypothetical protein
MINLGKKIGFKKIIPVICPNADANDISSQTAVALGHAKIIETVLCSEDTFEPFILFEDDINLWPDGRKEDQFKITYPVDTDSIYIGISNAGAHESGYCDEYNSLLYKHDPRYPNLMWIWNMLSTHAVVVLTKQFALFYMRAAIESINHDSVMDNLVSRGQTKYNVMALARPIFFQDARINGQEESTKIDFSKSNSTITDERFNSWIKKIDWEDYHKLKTISHIPVVKK